MTGLKYYFTLFLNIISCTFCSSIIDRVANGTPAEKGQFPFFVQMKIEYDRSTVYLCGASLVHVSWILTAAHCLPNTTEQRKELTWKGLITTYIGTNQRYGSDAYKEKVAKIFPHPNFIRILDHNGRLQKCQYDIAVARLRNPCKVNLYLAPVMVPPKTISVCNVGVIVGAGRTVLDPRKYHEYVLYVRVHPKTREELSNSKRPPAETVFYAEIKFMAGHELKGDSGGPFLCYFEDKVPVQFGVMSRNSFTVSKETYISVFEDVGKHLDFILKHVPAQVYRRPNRRSKDIKFRSNSSSDRVKVFLVFVCLSLNVMLKQN